MKTEIIKKDIIYQGFFTFEKATLRFEQFNGEMSRPVSRLHVYRADASAVLLYHSARKTVFLVKQFRYPMYTVGPGYAWTLEAVAGAIDEGASPEETAVREVEEEVGYCIAGPDLISAGHCWPSPGGTSEQIHCYIADVAQAKRAHEGGGVEHEAEDIQVVELGYNEMAAKIKSLEICDAKTLICWYWFTNNILKA